MREEWSECNIYNENIVRNKGACKGHTRMMISSIFNVQILENVILANTAIVISLIFNRFFRQEILLLSEQTHNRAAARKRALEAVLGRNRKILFHNILTNTK